MFSSRLGQDQVDCGHPWQVLVSLARALAMQTPITASMPQLVEISRWKSLCRKMLIAQNRTVFAGWGRFQLHFGGKIVALFGLDKVEALCVNIPVLRPR